MQNRLPSSERQAQIIAAALVLARNASPASITTGDVASAVGISQGAVFKHFATKDAIWVAAMQWVRADLMQTLATAATSGPTALDDLAAVFRAHVGFVAAHPGVPRFIFHELQQPLDSPAKREVRQVLQGYRTLLLTLLDRAARERSVAPGLDRDSAATMFVGIIQGLVMQSMLTGDTATMSVQAEPLLDLFLQAIRETS